MLSLNRDGRIIRFAYYTSEREIPAQTSLCALFWRLVGHTLLLVVLPSTIVGLIIRGFYLDWWFATKMTFGIVGGIGSIVGWFYLREAKGIKLEEYAKPVLDSRPVEFASAAVWAVKNRVCPIIQLRDSE